MKINKKSTNNILAIPALAAAMPVKPKMPATIEIRKKTNAHRNIVIIS